MTNRSGPGVETIRFDTADGVTLTGDLATVEAAAACAVVCHPHPQYGGDRFNPVVDALFSALSAVGYSTLRFDFRADFDGGRGEVDDVRAAVERVASAASGAPVVVAGYSFGAAMTLALDDARVAAKILVAPPLAMFDAAAHVEMPTLVLTPAHDQFTPPDGARPVVDGWPDATFEVVESVDHFLAGRAAHVAERSVTWLAGRVTSCATPGDAVSRWPPRSRP